MAIVHLSVLFVLLVVFPVFFLLLLSSSFSYFLRCFCGDIRSFHFVDWVVLVWITRVLLAFSKDTCGSRCLGVCIFLVLPGFSFSLSVSYLRAARGYGCRVCPAALSPQTEKKKRLSSFYRVFSLITCLYFIAPDAALLFILTFLLRRFGVTAKVHFPTKGNVTKQGQT